MRKTSKTNIQEEPPTLLKKLELLHPAHAQHRRGKSPTRVSSTTKQTTTDRDKEIEDLRNQIKLLQQNQKERDTQEQLKQTENKEEHPEHSFDTYKLLNKNLNFIPTSKRYNKNQLSSDLQNFFRLTNFELTLKMKPVLQQYIKQMNKYTLRPKIKKNGPQQKRTIQ